MGWSIDAQFSIVLYTLTDAGQYGYAFYHLRCIFLLLWCLFAFWPWIGKPLGSQCLLQHFFSSNVVIKSNSMIWFISILYSIIVTMPSPWWISPTIAGSSSRYVIYFHILPIGQCHQLIGCDVIELMMTSTELILWSAARLLRLLRQATLPTDTNSICWFSSATTLLYSVLVHSKMV